MSLEFENNGLYLLLSDRGDVYTFHWSLYLAKSPTEGDIFHIVNTSNSTDWRYDPQSSNTVATSNSYLLALKVGVLEPALHDALRDRLSQIPLEDSAHSREKITCRVWVKEALFTLDEEGYIEVSATVDQIEQEAKSQGMLNKSLRRKTVIKSKGSQA